MYYLIKRTVDVLGAVALIFIFSPIMITTSLVIFIFSPGPIFIEKTNKHSIRSGRNAKRFRLYKFRSMVVNAEKLLKNDPKYKKLYKEYKKSSYKLKNDPRIIWGGSFIRKFSIDEMPQFFNVLKGEMSLVGPRPYLPEELKEQSHRYPGTSKFIKQTQIAKPGITGYWQVTGRSNVAFDKRIQMDAYYARKKSLLFDLKILLKTPWAMLSGKGAH